MKRTFQTFPYSAVEKPRSYIENKFVFSPRNYIEVYSYIPSKFYLAVQYSQSSVSGASTSGEPLLVEQNLVHEPGRMKILIKIKESFSYV